MNVKRFKGSEKDVRSVKGQLLKIIDYYGFTTIADYYDIIGYTVSYVDNKYGWVSLENATITMSLEPETYELVLPAPIPISDCIHVPTITI